MKSKAVDKSTAVIFLSVLLFISAVAAVINAHMPNSAVPAAASSFSIGIGQTYSYPTDEKLFMTFKSYNPDIVTVDKNGVIKAVSKGSAIIKAGNSKINIVVCDAPQSIAFDEKEFYMGLGEEYNLKPQIPDVDYLIGLDYKSSDDSVVSVDTAGKIKAVAEGSATVSVSTYNGCTDECSISVKKAPDSISYHYESRRLFKGSNYNFKPDIPDGCASKNITIASDNKDVLKVEPNGTVTAVAEGSATITATSFNGKTASCSVSVSAIPAYIRTDLDPSKPMIAFTFDDGPNKPSTNAILDVLEQYNGSATFFIVGSRLNFDNNDECAKRMVSMGCQLGNHTYDHKHYGDDVTAEDIAKNIDIISSKTGQKPSAFRPTGGYMSDTVKENCQAPIFIWNLDTKDWKYRNADKIYETIMEYADDGDIILMHDIYSTTATAVERAVPELVEKGFQIVNAAELAYYKGAELENGEVYYSF